MLKVTASLINEHTCRRRAGGIFKTLTLVTLILLFTNNLHNFLFQMPVLEWKVGVGVL